MIYLFFLSLKQQPMLSRKHYSSLLIIGTINVLNGCRNEITSTLNLNYSCSISNIVQQQISSIFIQRFVTEKMNKFQGCRNVPEMSTKSGADKRQAGWIHQMQRFEWTICIPPVIPEKAPSSISNNITRRYLQFPINFSISLVY